MPGKIAIPQLPSYPPSSMRITKQMSPRRLSDRRMTATVSDLLAYAERSSMNEQCWKAAAATTEGMSTTYLAQHSLPSKTSPVCLSERQYDSTKSNRPMGWPATCSSSTLCTTLNSIPSPRTPELTSCLPYTGYDLASSTSQGLPWMNGTNKSSPSASSPFLSPLKSQYNSPSFLSPDSVIYSTTNNSSTLTDAATCTPAQYTNAESLNMNFGYDETITALESPSQPPSLEKSVGYKDENSFPPHLSHEWIHFFHVNSMNDTAKLLMTSPPTPQDFVDNATMASHITPASTQPSSYECRVNDEQMEEEELIGMGLYDDLDLVKPPPPKTDSTCIGLEWYPNYFLQSEHNGYSFNDVSRNSIKGSRFQVPPKATPSQPCKENQGKGLKLEETWIPPTSDSADEESDGEIATDEDDEDAEANDDEEEDDEIDDQGLHDNNFQPISRLWPSRNGIVPSSVALNTNLMSSQSHDIWSMQ